MTTEITEYSKTEAALSDLAHRYKGVIFDVSTRDGMLSAIKARAEIRGYRVGLEKVRVKIKADALARCQLIDGEARRITHELEVLEVPIDDQIKADERGKIAEAEAKIKAEADRIAAEEAARRAAEERVLAAQRAEIARQQEELAAKQCAAEAEQAAVRRKIEEEQRQARLAIDIAERASRAIIEAAELEAKRKREADEARIKAEQAAEAKRIREAQEKVDAERRVVEEVARQERLAQERREREAREADEARQREIKRKQDELLDARATLTMFKERYGQLSEFAPVVSAITAYFKAIKWGHI